jgi:sugar phosphate isomerase/epimerase
MIIAVSSYSYEALYGKDGFDLFSAIKKTAEIGYGGIEFTGLEAPAGMSVLDYAARVKAACSEAGLKIVNYAVGADFLYGSDRNPDKVVEKLKANVDVAAALGSPLMRHDSAHGIRPGDARFPANSSWQDVVAYIAPYIRSVAEYAQTRGVKTCTENHGMYMQDSERVEALIRAVNHPNYGALVDMGNFLCADEAGLSALPRMMPYAVHVHCKDFLWKSGTEESPGDGWFGSRACNWLRGTVLGHGVVKVGQCLDYIKKCGYEGAVSLEFEGPEDVLYAITAAYKLMKKHLG